MGPEGTELTLLHERCTNAEDLGDREHGWTGSLEKLAAVVGRLGGGDRGP